MAKTRSDFDPARYAPVAERIALFFETFPEGRIITTLVTRTRDDVVFRAAVYRRIGEPAAATGWAAERESDGDVNTVACLENTETSAIGRALANLGFTASRQRPSREEMLKAGRANAAMQAQADAVADVLALLRTAERLGCRPARAAALRRHLTSAPPSRAALRGTTTVLRRWIDKRRAELLTQL